MLFRATDVEATDALGLTDALTFALARRVDEASSDDPADCAERGSPDDQVVFVGRIVPAAHALA